ncbi:MAG: hypothetical protein DMG62_18380 [Acidobacteria bacterium]|nr:MAG: hypothetical protein DMG62_18380 [Acidobacteriota bacterium]
MSIGCSFPAAAGRHRKSCRTMLSYHPGAHDAGLIVLRSARG